MFLLIDDTPSNLEALQENLQDLSGEGVICATNLQAGLNAIAQYPDITTVLVDLRLPGVDSLEALEAVSAQLKKVGNQSAIVSTMSMFPTSRKEAVQRGAKMSLDTRRMLDPESDYLSLVLAIADNTALVNKLTGELESVNKKMADPWILWSLAKKNPAILAGLGLLIVTNEPVLKAIYQGIKKFLGQ